MRSSAVPNCNKMGAHQKKVEKGEQRMNACEKQLKETKNTPPEIEQGKYAKPLQFEASQKGVALQNLPSARK